MKTRTGILVLALAASSMSDAAYCQKVEKGKSEYFNHCASCHGQTAKGDGPVAQFLSRTPADLTKLSTANDGVFPAARIFELIDGRREVGVHGTREMPVWGRATRYAPAIVRDRIRSVVDYIATLQGK